MRITYREHKRQSERRLPRWLWCPKNAQVNVGKSRHSVAAPTIRDGVAVYVGRHSVAVFASHDGVAKWVYNRGTMSKPDAKLPLPNDLLNWFVDHHFLTESVARNLLTPPASYGDAMASPKSCLSATCSRPIKSTRSCRATVSRLFTGALPRRRKAGRRRHGAGDEMLEPKTANVRCG